MLDKSIIHSLDEIVGKGNLDIVSERVYLFPPDSKKISEIIGFAQRRRLKVLPVGKESKINYDDLLTGKEIIIKSDNFSEVKKVAPGDLYVTLGAGYELGQLNRYLLSHNLFFPFSLEETKGTVAGAIATGLEAENSNKRISIKDYLLSLEVVGTEGEVLNVGANVFKSVTGYDLPRLFVGSWGTLGIITEVSLRLVPLNRKREFENMKLVPSNRPKLDKNSKDYNTILSLRLKEGLDPKGIFLPLQ